MFYLLKKHVLMVDGKCRAIVHTLCLCVSVEYRIIQ